MYQHAGRVEAGEGEMNFYNDNDKKACAWLRELIAQGHLPPGTVDERSILEIKADELKEYAQCHFFAGVGFWSLALQWAGLGSTPGIWTGSCPCQTFSCAGAGKGAADERHLWPVFRNLIAAVEPAVVFGEQVASAAVVGKVGRGVAAPAVPVWLDGVRADLEAEGYTCGHTVLGAHSVGAPHIRQRVYWVADSGARDTAEHGPEVRRDVHGELHREGLGEGCGNGGPSDAEALRRQSQQEIGPEHGEMDSATGKRVGARGNIVPRWPSDAILRGIGGGNLRGLGASGRQVQEPQDGAHPSNEPCDGHADALRTSDVQRTRLEGHAGDGADGDEPGRHGAESAGHVAKGGGACGILHAESLRRGSSANGTEGVRTGTGCCAGIPWSDSIVHRYLDGKDRRIPAEPRLFPLADDRHPYHRGRVGLLRGAGNAIVPALAKEFIEAWKEVTR